MGNFTGFMYKNGKTFSTFYRLVVAAIISNSANQIKIN